MVNNFKRVSAFFPLIATSKDLTDVNLKTAKMIAFDDTPSSMASSLCTSAPSDVHRLMASCVDIMTGKW